MVIPTDDDRWKNAEVERPYRDQILDFLSANPTQAFNVRELADEVADTSWDSVHDGKRLAEVIADGEENFEDDPNSDVVELELLILHHLRTVFIRSEASELVDDGSVEARKVSTEETDVPMDSENIRYYSYSSS